MTHKINHLTKDELLDQTLSTLNTGDIILFKGNRFISSFICFMTQSHWSHIGIVIKDEQGNPLLFEATTVTETPDIELGKPVDRGITLVCLKQRIMQYPGKVAVRRLEGVRRCCVIQKNVKQFVEHFKGRPYKRYSLAFLNGFLPKALRVKMDGLFCSELVAEVYKRVDILGDERSSYFFVPGHFQSAKHLNLKKGQLSTELFLK